jgi:phosphoserine phosphatase RsbU/P
MSDASAPTVSASHLADAHALQCMEIVGGNRTTDQLIATPCLDIWVTSRPHRGDAGGDVYYFSMCGSGRVTRLAIGDISGHGREADETARWLRAQMRKHINLLDQTRLARAINAEFPGDEDVRRFATVLFVTYFAPTQHVIVCNAGHPRPIWFSRRLGQWRLLDEDTTDTGTPIRAAKGRYLFRPVANLPIGVIERTDYYQFAVQVDPGDLILVYTDALIEAADPQGTQLGEEGLLRLAGEVAVGEPEEVARALVAKVDAWRGHVPPNDDQTLVVLRRNAAPWPGVRLTQALKSAAKMVGLVRV